MLLQSAIATPLPCLYYCCCFKNQNPTCLLPKTPFLQNLDTKFSYYYSSAKANSRGSFFQSGNGCGIKSNKITSPRATLLEAPLVWAGRVCIFYALIKIGLAGSPASPFVSSDSDTATDDLGFSEWLSKFRANPDKEASDKRKLVRKWHRTTKGTLRRNYRVPSTSVGRHLLRLVASLLSEDDHFRDATSHKGCQIRRQNAHGESVCCNNVRALFDELPTPHLIVEITPFPAGPLTDNDYAKAEKLEKVLRSGPSV